MKRLILTFIVSQAILSVCAKEEIVDLFVKPGSIRGYISVENQQKIIPESLLVDAIEILRERLRYDVRFTNDKLVSNAAAIRLAITDDPKNPAPMTVSPEIGIGTLNVAALTNGISSVESVRRLLPNRAKLEFLRLICYAFGVGGSQFSGNLLSATSLRELDEMKPFLPVDIFDKIEKSGRARGLYPEIVAEYSEACQQGWAPAPTNAIQKAIWDKVHAAPKNPMKIEFDPKKGR